jgi:hypothetical protein
MSVIIYEILCIKLLKFREKFRLEIAYINLLVPFLTFIRSSSPFINYIFLFNKLLEIILLFFKFINKFIFDFHVRICNFKFKLSFF